MKNYYKLQNTASLDMEAIVDLLNKILYLKDDGNSIEYDKTTLKYCYLLLDELGYWNEFIDDINGNSTIQSINNFLSKTPKVSNEYLEGMKVTKDKIEEQFYKVDNMDKTELQANLMFVSNKIAHILSENKDIMEVLKKENCYAHSSTFFGIKATCINNLIMLKNMNEKILMECKKDKNGISAITIALPNYFKPFQVHLGKNDNDVALEALESDSIGYERWKGENLIDKISDFPFKVTDNMNEIIALLNRNKSNERLSAAKKEIEWYCGIMELFDIRFGTHYSERFNVSKTPVNEDKKMKNRGRKRYTQKPQKPTKEEILKENEEFWQKLNAKNDNILNEQIMKHIIAKANYSYNDLYEKLKPTIHKNIDELVKNSNDDVVDIIFIYIRLTSTMSLIDNGKIKGSELNEIVLDAVCKYEKAYEYLKKHKDDENLGIRNLKNAMVKYIETNGETDLLKDKGTKVKIRKPRKTRKTEKPAEKSAEKSELENGVLEPVEANEQKELDAVDKTDHTSVNIGDIEKLRDSIKGQLKDLEDNKSSISQRNLVSKLLNILDNMDKLNIMCDQLTVDKGNIEKARINAKKSSEIAEEAWKKAEEAQKNAEEAQAALDSLTQQAEVEESIRRDIEKFREETESYFNR